jgi:sugar lactone lactonase YvrE
VTDNELGGNAVTTPLTQVPVPVATLGEGPIWDAGQQALYWVDIPECLVHRLDADGSITTWAAGQPVGTVVPRASGGLVVAARDGFMAMDPDTGHLTMLAAVEQDRAQTRMNDGACDRTGRFYAGTMAADESPGLGTLYRLDLDLQVSKLATGLGISNGIGWSPDERLMYYIDSLDHQVDVFDYDAATGAIEGRRKFAAVGGGDVVPDGLTVDADGNVWVAVWGGAAVLRHDPDGRVRQTVEVPATQVTSCVFGGPDLDRLYITSAAGGGAAAGGLFVCEPGVTGQPSHPFRG